MSVVEVNCKLAPLLQPYLTRDLIRLDSQFLVLHTLKPSLPRGLYDYMLKSNQVTEIFDHLQDRQLVRNIQRHHHHLQQPDYGEMSEMNLAQVFSKLISQGMTEEDEDKLLCLRDVMLKVHQQHSKHSSQHEGDSKSPREGLVVIGETAGVRRCVDMVGSSYGATTNNQSSVTATPSANTSSSAKVPGKNNVSHTKMNEEWKQMFGPAAQDNDATSTRQPDSTSLTGSNEVTDSTTTGGGTSSPITVLSASVISSPAAELQQVEVNSSDEETKHTSTTTTTTTAAASDIVAMIGDGVNMSRCLREVREFVGDKRSQHATDVRSREMAGNGVAWHVRCTPPRWQAKGSLVAHLHEHRAAVNRLQVLGDTMMFATCSDDSTVKLWDCGRMEGKNVANRAKQTYAGLGAPVKCLCFCHSHQSLAASNESGAYHVCRLETGSSKMVVEQTGQVDINEDGPIVDMKYYDNGSQNILTYGCLHGRICGLDLRCNKPAFTLNNDPHYGLLTTFCIDYKQCWLAAGTHNGVHICWDMRFQLPISTFRHSAGSRVRCLSSHPSQHSWLISSVSGNNEVSIWDMESASRQMTLWASPSAPLSFQMTQGSVESVLGMQVLQTSEGGHRLLTAGSDQRVRMWDLQQVVNSHIVCPAATDHNTSILASYRSRLIDGTAVVQEEVISKPRHHTATPPLATAPPLITSPGGGGGDEVPRRGPDSPPTGHHDTITDVALCYSSQCLIITTCKDGVVKVWK